MTAHVFTYGSLMFDEVWSRVVAGTYAPVPATLAGHARRAVDGETYPGMVEADGSSVRGLLYLDVDEADLERLDRFEGDDYRRIRVPLACDDGRSREGDTYLYLASSRLSPDDWDPGRFEMQQFLDSYVRAKLDR